MSTRRQNYTRQRENYKKMRELRKSHTINYFEIKLHYNASWRYDVAQLGWTHSEMQLLIDMRYHKHAKMHVRVPKLWIIRGAKRRKRK